MRLSEVNFDEVREAISKNAASKPAEEKLLLFCKDIENISPFFSAIEIAKLELITPDSKEKVKTTESLLVKYSQNLKTAHIPIGKKIGSCRFFQEHPHIKEHLSEIKNETEHAHKIKIDSDSQLSELQEDNKLKTAAISALKSQKLTREAEKLFHAYEEEATSYFTQRKNWLRRTHWSFIILALSVLLTLGGIFFPVFLPFIEIFKEKSIELDLASRLSLYALDFVAISWVWFCSKQFETADQNYDNFTNRKTVAKSLKGILDSFPTAEEEINETTRVQNTNIKNKFLEKAADILFSNGILHNKKSNLPMEEVMKLISSLVKK